MDTFPRTFISAVLASSVAAIPVAALGAASGDGVAIAMVFVAITWTVTAAHVVLLGVPAFFVLRRFDHANRSNLLAAGFVLGFLPVTVALFRDISQGGSALLLPVIFGILGMLSAWVFWTAWCRLAPNNSSKPTFESLPASDAA